MSDKMKKIAKDLQIGYPEIQVLLERITMDFIEAEEHAKACDLFNVCNTLTKLGENIAKARIISEMTEDDAERLESAKEKLFTKIEDYMKRFCDFKPWGPG